MASVKVTNKDKGMDKLLADLRKQHPKAVVGILGSAAARAKTDTTDLTVVEVATFHEFGTTRVPERSFIRATVDQERDRIIKRMRRTAKSMVEGIANLEGHAFVPPSVAIGRLGLFVAGKMKRFISAGISPALKPETIRRKGSSKPLIDKGQLQNSIGSEVRT